MPMVSPPDESYMLASTAAPFLGLDRMGVRASTDRLVGDLSPAVGLNKAELAAVLELALSAPVCTSMTIVAFWLRVYIGANWVLLGEVKPGPALKFL